MVRAYHEKLFLIFHGRFPSEKAAALFAAKSAASFAGLGCDVVVLAPRRLGRFGESPFDFYGLERNFRVIFLPTVDFFRIPVLKRAAFFASFASFSVFTFFYLLFYARRGDVIYSNESLPLFFASFFFPKTVYEIHDFPKNNFYYRTIFKHASWFIATNRWKKRKIEELLGVPKEKIIAEPNAVSLDDFKAKVSQREAREKLSLPLDAKLVCYVGALRTMGMEKGIEILLEAVKSVASCKLLVVGGSREDVEFYKRKAADFGVLGRIIFTGFVPHKAVPLYLTASDILIAPFPKNDHYEFFMSPMKIFEYMASNRPIIASDLQSIREILPPGSGILIQPDNPKALVAAVAEIFSDGTMGKRLADNALHIAREHTWEKRARRILDFIDA